MARHPLGCLLFWGGSAHPPVSGGYTDSFFFLVTVAAGFFLHIFLIFCTCLMFLPQHQLFIYWIELFSLAATLSGIILEWLLQRGFVSKSPCH